ncbi:MAG: hypothetical protein E5W55_11665, partial [Mesorhizobium sp.]
MPGWRFFPETSNATPSKAPGRAQGHGKARRKASTLAISRRDLKGTKMTIAKETASILEKLGVAKDALSGGDLIV